MFQYRERMHLTRDQALSEPAEEIERAFIIWGYEEAKRAKLEAERQLDQD